MLCTIIRKFFVIEFHRFDVLRLLKIARISRDFRWKIHAHHTEKPFLARTNARIPRDRFSSLCRKSQSRTERITSSADPIWRGPLGIYERGHCPRFSRRMKKQYCNGTHAARPKFVNFQGPRFIAILTLFLPLSFPVFLLPPLYFSFLVRSPATTVRRPMKSQSSIQPRATKLPELKLLSPWRFYGFVVPARELMRSFVLIRRDYLLYPPAFSFFSLVSPYDVPRV